MRFFLKAKHWQLFILLFGPMFFARALRFNFIMNGKQASPILVLLPAALIGALFFGWLWSVSAACSRELPKELVSSPRPMQVGLVYALFYLAISGFFFGSGASLPGYIIIMHMMAMVAMFYALGFTAKQLAKLELKKAVSFYEYSGPFFLFWFFPVGIWFIQPKVNKLLGSKNA